MLREGVDVLTGFLGGKLKGHLFVGENHLPELWVEYSGECKHAQTESLATFHKHHFLPSQFPAAWRLRPMGEDGLLLKTWLAIQELQSDIAQAEREAEADDIARSRWQHDEQVAAEYDRAEAEERDQANQQSIDNQVAAGRIVAGGGCSNESGS